MTYVQHRRTDANARQRNELYYLVSGVGKRKPVVYKKGVQFLNSIFEHASRIS